MENPSTSTTPTPRYLIVNQPTKQAVTESDISVAYLGGLLIGGLLVGFTVAGVMSINHERDRRKLREEFHRASAASSALERDLQRALARATAMLDRAEGAFDNVTPLHPGT